MSDPLEEISEQLHEIRNFVSPLDFKLESLVHKVEKSRAALESKTIQLESKILEQAAVIAHNAEQIRQIRLFLKMPEIVENRPPGAVHEDKQNPVGMPPIAPPN